MKILRSISVVGLSLLVLVSSTSFVVGIHICMGEVDNIALLTKAAECEMERNLPPCHKKMQSCCENETLIHNADDVKASLSEIHLHAIPAIDVDLPMVILSEIIPSAPAAQADFDVYHPPLRSYDLTVEHQSLLI